MNQIITAFIAVAAVLMPGCKSPSLCADSIGEREIFIIAKINPTTIEDVMNVCSSLEVVNVEEYYTGDMYEPNYDMPSFDIRHIEYAPIVRLKLTFKTNNNGALNQARNGLLRLQEVVSADIH